MDTQPLGLTPHDFQAHGTPLPEVTELSPDTGWNQWDLAVRLLDVKSFAKKVWQLL
jgi:hypothetical protein